MVKAYETSGGTMFGEKQAFPGWLAWIMLSPVLLAVGIIALMPSSEEFKEKEMGLGIAILFLVQVVLFFLFRKTKFEKQVTTNGLYFRWTPLQRRFRVIEKQEIIEAQVRKAPSLKYGSHWVPGYGRMHTANRGDGVQLILSNGKKIFFGSADAISFNKVLQELVQSNRKIHWRES